MPVEVQTFESPFGKARVVLFSDGTPWFVAKDVCEGLGLGTKQVSRHLARLKDNQKQMLRNNPNTITVIRELMSGPGRPEFNLISRGGFNDMVLESRKPVAREYRQWVTDKVLPALHFHRRSSIAAQSTRAAQASSMIARIKSRLSVMADTL